MIEIANLEEWTKEYFSDPENQKKAEKACERYDRLMVKNIKRQLSGGAEKIFLNEEPADDPGKCMEKAKYEELAAQYPGMPHYTIDAGHEKIPAGWMIDQCGWKGKSLGRAGVHSKQALVLVNKGGATGNDIVCLCDHIRKDVQDKFGIDIHPEVNII